MSALVHGGELFGILFCILWIAVFGCIMAEEIQPMRVRQISLVLALAAFLPLFILIFAMV